MVPGARTTLAWLCITAVWTYLVCSTAAQVPAQQLGTTSVHAAAAEAQRAFAHKPSNANAAAEAEAAAMSAGGSAGRTLLQGSPQKPNIQLHSTPEDPVPPVVIDSHHPDPSTAAAVPVGVDNRKGTMVKKGFLVHPEHKRLLPIDYKDICLFVLSFMVLSLAAGAGIGGGVLLVPMLSLITGFGNIQTVALSNITIFSGAITNMLFNLPRKNPFRGGPIIDYDLLLLFGPPIVMGSIAGSYINYFVPGWVTKTLVLLVLTPMTWRMINKARMLWIAESRRVSAEAQQPGGLHWSASELLGSSSIVGGSSMELVPEEKELSGDVELARVSGLKLAPTLTSGGQLEAADSIKRHQHQLPPLTTAQHGTARISNHNAGGSVAGVLLSPTSAGGGHSGRRPSVHRCASVPADKDPAAWGQPDGSALAARESLQGASRTHSHANVLAALSDRPPSLADLLGPYFVVLTTPQVADATLQAQALSRQVAQLQRTNSVTRRHTLDTSLQNSPCFRANNNCSSTSSRPSSAPTVPCDSLWDTQQDAYAGDNQCTGVAGGSPTCGLSVDGNNPLSIISPFQLYQQQRCQNIKHQDKQHGQVSCDCCGEHDKQQQQQQQPPPCPDKQAALPQVATGRCGKLVHTCCVHSAELDAQMRKKIHHHMTAQVPKAHVSALLLMLAAVIVTSVAATLQLTCGTWEYWLVVLTPLPLMLLVWALMRWHVLWRVGWQNILDMTHPTDIVWTATSTLKYPAVVITVGVMAGMLGLGGGIVLAPLLLELGVQPAVSAASSQAAMLMSSCTSTVVYLVADALPKDYGIAMAIIGFTGTLFGQIAFNYAVQRTGRSSILVFILAVLFVLASGAAVVVVCNSITTIVRMPAKLTMTYAHDICKMKGG